MVGYDVSHGNILSAAGFYPQRAWISRFKNATEAEIKKPAHSRRAFEIGTKDERA
jgi:hypothetical protein